MILEVLRQLLTLVESGLQTGVCDVACHDDRTVQAHTGRNGILGQLSTYGIDTLVEIDGDALGTLTRLCVLLGNQLSGVGIHLLNPDTVLIDLSLDVAVSRAAHTHTDRTGSAMTGQTDHADVVSQVLATELCTESDLVGLEQELLLQVDVAESAASLITCGRQVVVVLDRTELHGQQVLLSRCTADDEADVIRRTSSRSKALHLLYQEGEQRALVLDRSLGHGVEIGLVGRTATLSHTDETILSTLGSLDVDLCGEVATGVHLVVHRQRSVLRVAQVVLCIGIVNTTGKSFLILEAGPYLLTLLTMDDGGTGVLAERQHALHGCLGIAEELQSHILVILRGLGIFQDGGHLLIVLATEHELTIVEALLCQQRQGLGSHFQDLMTFESAYTHSLLGKQTVLGVVLSGLEHGSILELRFFCHNVFVRFNMLNNQYPNISSVETRRIGAIFSRVFVSSWLSSPRMR